MSYFSLELCAKQYLITTTDNLQQVLDNSADGDVITLAAGRYLGNFVINKQITLQGVNPNNNKTIIDAQGKGHALELKNSHITIANLNIINWGGDMTEQKFRYLFP